MEDLVSMLIHYGSIFLMVLWGLVFVTNIIVEVLKVLVPGLPAAFLAVGVAMGVTMLAFFVLCSVCCAPVKWYWAAGAAVMGLFVGYAAMFGFDKFREAWEKLKGLQGK